MKPVNKNSFTGQFSPVLGGVRHLGGTPNDQCIVVADDLDELGFRHGLLEVHRVAPLFEDVDAALETTKGSQYEPSNRRNTMMRCRIVQS
jgi:hypothetical protein